MGAVSPEELARLWTREDITTEMAVGQIVQNLVRLQNALDNQRQLNQSALEVQRQLLTALQVELKRIVERQNKSK